MWGNLRNGVLWGLLRIVEVFVFCHFKHFVEIFGGFPAGFGQVHKEVVAAVFGRLAGHFSVEGGDEGEGFSHEGEDVGGGEVAAHEEVVACEASHWSPVDYAVFPCGVVA